MCTTLLLKLPRARTDVCGRVRVRVRFRFRLRQYPAFPLTPFPPPNLTLNGSQMARVTSYKYLGVLITSDLMWSDHVVKVCNKTRRLIGVLYRSFYKHSTPSTMLKLYNSFIRPHLEYATAVWDPFLKKDIKHLEDVQKFGLRVCNKSWNSGYDDLLTKSKLPTLQSRRQQSKLCQLYKIINETTFYPAAPTQSREYVYSSRSVHSHPLVPLHARSSQFQNSFFPSSIEAWNSLPESVVSASTFNSFKYLLKNN